MVLTDTTNCPKNNFCLTKCFVGALLIILESMTWPTERITSEEAKEIEQGFAEIQAGKGVRAEDVWKDKGLTLTQCQALMLEHLLAVLPLVNMVQEFAQALVVDDFALLLVNHITAKPFKHGRSFRSGSATLGNEGVFCSTVNQSRAAGPLDGRDSIFGNIAGIVVGEDIGIFTDAYIIALVLSVAVQYGC